MDVRQMWWSGWRLISLLLIQAIKEQNEEIQKEYGFCFIDGHKEKIGNFRIEPPGLFRGRGEHPKMGMLKKRVMPEDVIINCSKDSAIPKAPNGHRWKKVQHDPSVSVSVCPSVCASVPSISFSFLSYSEQIRCVRSIHCHCI